MNVTDLSLDALGRLEAKLLTDLDLVRKVKALLVEHQAAWQATPGSAPVSGGMPAPPSAAVAPKPPGPPSPPHSDSFLGVLTSLPTETFRLSEFKDEIWRQTKKFPEDSDIKLFMYKVLRNGTVEVVSTARGRRGNEYRCTLPRMNAATDETPSADPAVNSGEKGVVSADVGLGGEE